jgi:hypothetical protein
MCHNKESGAATLKGFRLPKFVIGQIKVIEPAEKKGICSRCLKEFDLHYIAGTTDLCMSHINPGFI